MITDRQKELTSELIRASELYYSGAPIIMSDIEFDKKLEELKRLEQESGVVLENSPTTNVGAQSVNELKKSKHEYPALSLSKIKYKDREDILKWLETVDNSAVVSLKMDGLTVVVTYENGKMVKAVTRGDGIIGSDVTHNAKFFKGLPLYISYNGKLIVRGESTMTLDEFERVNLLSGDVYENPRNLASATIQMLNANESKQREIWFTAFEIANPIEELNNYNEQLDFLIDLGISSVNYEIVNSENVLSTIEKWKKIALDYRHPTDGLVFKCRDVKLFNELGYTGSHPRGAIALKWTDETVTTTIRDIEWSVGRTGIVTPVAVFDSVRLGLGSNVSRASLHNLTVMSRVPNTSGNVNGVKIGSKAEVYLANAIIPQIASVDNGGDTSDIKIPSSCPVCGHKLSITENNGIEVLMCKNSDCPAQAIGKLMNSFSNNGLRIKGLGEKQIEDLIEVGLSDYRVLSYYEMFEKYKDSAELPYELKDKDGWGIKKWNNLMDTISDSKHTDLPSFIYALNIPLIAKNTAKIIARELDNDILTFISIIIDKDLVARFANYLKGVEGVGNVKSTNIYNWYVNLCENNGLKDLLKLIMLMKFKEIEEMEIEDNSLNGLNFVITGKVFKYKNRNEFKESVERRGGKVNGAVNSKTDFLIINDLNSNSSKAKKARELNIKMLSEKEFIEKFGR